MARASSVQVDTEITRDDRLFGSSLTGSKYTSSNYPVGSLTNYFREEILGGLSNNSLLLNNNGEAIESFITNNIRLNVVGSEDQITDVERAVRSINAQQLYVGNAIRSDFFDSLAIGRRLIFYSNRTGERIVTTVLSFIESTGLITLNDQLTAVQLAIFGDSGTFDNVLTAVTNLGTSIEGDLAINGNITGEFSVTPTISKASVDAAIGVSSTGDENKFYNQEGDHTEVSSIVNQNESESGLLKLWCGTEGAYQTLVTNNEVDDNTAYLRTQ